MSEGVTGNPIFEALRREIMLRMKRASLIRINTTTDWNKKEYLQMSYNNNECCSVHFEEVKFEINYNGTQTEIPSDLLKPVKLAAVLAKYLDAFIILQQEIESELVKNQHYNGDDRPII